MAHQLDLTTGKAAMAYVGDTPWHGLGQQLSVNSPLEVWLREAGMDWTINEAPAAFVADDGQVNAVAVERVVAGIRAVDQRVDGVAHFRSRHAEVGRLVPTRANV